MNHFHLPRSNAEFLVAIFPREDIRNIHIASFTCPPEASGRHDWAGYLVAGAYTAGAATHLENYNANNFFTVSTFDNSQNDIARRRKADFIGQHVVVLDDLGTGDGSKSSMDLLKGRPVPSWIMETSAGNTQVGYILTTSISDHELMSRFDDAMINQGMASDGDNGQRGVTRYMRMFGVNNKTKYSAPFQTRLTWWNPTQTYTLLELVDGWGLILADKRARRSVTALDAEKDIVHRVLVEEDLYGDDQASGFISCPCPNEDQHTIHDYRQGYNPDVQGYECPHGSCQDLTRNDLRGWLQDNYPDTYRRIEIEITFGVASPAQVAAVKEAQVARDAAEWDSNPYKELFGRII